MKKISLYIAALLIVVAFTACDDNYDDWAAPQTNEQESAKDISFQASVVAGSIDLNTVTTDSIEIIKIDNITIEEGGTAQYEVYLGLDDEFAEQIGLPFAEKNNQIKVSTNDFEDALWAFYGKEGKSNSVKLRIYAIVITANGQATRVKTADMSLVAITKSLVIEENYYMVGTVNDWKQTGLPQFTSLGEGLFELIIDLTEDKTYFKIIPQSGLDDLDKFWGTALGSAKNDDDSKAGTLVYQREGEPEPGAMLIYGAGEMKIQLDMNNYTYKIGPKFEIPETMYITGSPWGWDIPGSYGLTPMNSADGFWKVVYLEAGSEIKFFPEASWDNGIGFMEATIPAESISLAGLTDNGGNVKVANAGWYIVALTVTADGDYTIQFAEPQIWLIGNTSNGGWSDIATNPADIFTIPADASGEFVSPAFVASDDLRMAIALPGIDWWKTEFNIFDGKIEYRGKGGDQAAVPVIAGQKAYLNFGSDTGRIQ
ncbi:DUF5115 domain-containing protein [Bacteroides sp. 51]|uniref:Outer membrane protein SusF domain-containing protein n=1 Tax=Bacteroides sp. 51 TaxID=2302938 RepID=UPI0013D8AC96|nr:DUF5115 domain-containing protein [Bacteroides sp. 51]NDV82853.1 DUF5115 domain-containing protein [Bacteroides sp. 51]